MAQVDLDQLRDGKRWGRVGGGLPRPYNLYVRRVADGDYRVVAAYRLPEIHDENPGSVVCGCDFQGRSHAHGERQATTTTEAAALYAETAESLDRRRPITWAARVGA